MKLTRSVQQFMRHQFNLAPTWKARIIHRDYMPWTDASFKAFHRDLKYIYEQLSTSLHDAFEWAAKKILPPLDVGLCLLGICYGLFMALSMLPQVLVSTSIKEGF